MKVKALLTALLGAVAIQGAVAGTSWCPQDSGGKGCRTSCCPDLGASISIGYDNEYVFKGLRLAQDIVWFDANYTLDNLPLSPYIGVRHISDLGSGGGAGPLFNYGDETRLYTGVNLPSILGFDSSLTYTYFLFPSQRLPQALPLLGNSGDSQSQVSLNLSREILCGLTLNYTLDYLFGATTAGTGLPGQFQSIDGWMHTLALTKSFCITDCIGLDLSGGVLYNDNYWSYGRLANGVGGNVQQLFNNGRLNADDNGWHSYFVRADLPIALNCRTTLTPYVQYNGTPDGWTGDGMWATRDGALLQGVGLGVNPLQANLNDVLSWGLRLGVTF